MKGKGLKGIEREIEIPGGTEADVEENEVEIKSGDKKNRRRFSRVIIEKKENKLLIKTAGSTKKEKKQVNSIAAHIANMIKGVGEEFAYKMQICSVHFPMNVSVKGDEVVVKNFLGETRERKAKILPEATVKVERDIITVISPNKEAAGQTAANIEKAVRVRKKDIRIFQDGIFMIEKAGRAI